MIFIFFYQIVFCDIEEESSGRNGCSMSSIGYVGFMLIMANTLVNVVSNVNSNNNNNNNNNNDNNNNNWNAGRSFEEERSSDLGENLCVYLT